MAEVINREKLLMELDRLSKNQTDYNTARGIHAAIHLVEKAPEVSPCIGCQKENCQWRHCAPPEQKPINWEDMQP